MASLWVGLVACSFDSNTDSVGGNSLGDGESTGASDSNVTTPGGSASSAGSTLPSEESTKGPTSTTVDPMTTTTTESASSTDPTSDTNAENTATDSATSNGTSSSTDPSTGPVSTGPTAEPYGDCPTGGDDECEAGETCLTITIDRNWQEVIVGSWCGEADCGSDDDCPPPSEGTAVPDCRGPKAGPFCTLDCQGGATCPGTMECETFWSASAGDYVDNCVWPVP